jgi:hypothetical protein
MGRKLKQEDVTTIPLLAELSSMWFPGWLIGAPRGGFVPRTPPLPQFKPRVTPKQQGIKYSL